MIRDHQRAILAERHVRSVDAGPKDDSKAYGAICMKLPILVHQAGLAAALHHVAQLSTEKKRVLLEHLAEQLGEAGILGKTTAEGLLRKTREADTAALITTTREVQRCLEWYRRFTKTILKVDPTEDA